jgi:tetratricopeptide (TPR) repeat protein
LSKQAALALLAAQKAIPPGKEIVGTVRKMLNNSPRAGAQWLLSWARGGDDLAAMMSQWARLVDAEDALLKKRSDQTSADIVSGLLRLQVAWLKKLGRGKEAAEAVARLVQLGNGEPQEIAELLEWLLDLKDWKAAEALGERFAAQVAANPLLLYAVAEAQAEQGAAARAEQTAQRAIKLHPGPTREQLVYHLWTALRLQQRGRLVWAKREFDHVVANAAPTSDVAVGALSRMAEMLHDAQQDRQAGEALQKLVIAMGVNRPAEAQIAGLMAGEARTMGEIRARMHYFFACDLAAKGRRAEQIERLDKALAEFPTEVEVLIACYHLANMPAAYHQRIRKLIEKAAAELSDKIDDEPDSSSNYNQYAWLIGNTAGDLDQALQFSKKSLELSPNTGGYYDTLARVYFTKGDYDSAVKNQAKAAELDPHSPPIIRQLDLFRKTLEEKKKKK